MANRNDLNTGTNSGAQQSATDWTSEERYWRDNYSSRPYAKADRDFDFYSPGYRYGHESANRYRGREWNDVESDLRSGWDRSEHRGANQSTWEDIKDSVKDAWNRATGKDAGTRRSDPTVR